MATKVAEGTAEFSANVQPAKDALADMVAAAKQAAEKIIETEELTEGARRRAAERQIKMVERALERQVIAQEKAAVRAAKAVEREAERKIRAEERAAKAAAAAANKSSSSWGNAFKSLNQNQLVSEAETISALFIQVGGSVSRVASVVTSAIRPLALLGTTLGPVSLAAVGVAASLASIPLAGYAAYSILDSITSSAAEAAERLRKLGQEVENTGGLAEYTRAVEALNMSWDRAAVTLGQGLGHEMAVFTTALGQGVEALAAYTVEAVVFYQGLTDILSFGLKPIINGLEVDLYNALTKVARETVAANTAMANYDSQLKLVAASAAAAAKSNEQIAQADEAEGKRQQAIADEAERKRKAAITAHKAWVRDLQQAVENGNKAMAEAEAARRTWFQHDQEMHEEMRKGNLAFAENIDMLRQIGVNAMWAKAQIDAMAEQKKIDDFKAKVGALAEKFAVVGQVVQALGMITSEVMTAQVDAANAWDERLQKSAANEKKANQELSALRKKLSEEGNAQSRKTIQNQIAEVEAERDAYAERRANRQEQYDQHARLARRAFIADKVAALSQIAINTAVGIMQAYASLPTPAAIAASIGIGALGAVEAGIVAAKRPPEYPMGLSGLGGTVGPSPDHPVIRAMQPEERIAISGGREDDDRIRRENERRPGARNGETVVIVEVDGRQITGASSSGARVKVDPRAGKIPRGGWW